MLGGAASTPRKRRKTEKKSDGKDEKKADEGGEGTSAGGGVKIKTVQLKFDRAKRDEEEVFHPPAVYTKEVRPVYFSRGGEPEEWRRVHVPHDLWTEESDLPSSQKESVEPWEKAWKDWARGKSPETSSPLASLSASDSLLHTKVEKELDAVGEDIDRKTAIAALVKGLGGYPSLIVELAQWLDHFPLQSEGSLVKHAGQKRTASERKDAEASGPKDPEGPGRACLVRVLTDEALARYTVEGGVNVVEVRGYAFFQCLPLSSSSCRATTRT